jgi:hypothetical protein
VPSSSTASRSSLTNDTPLECSVPSCLYARSGGALLCRGRHRPPQANEFGQSQPRLDRHQVVGGRFFVVIVATRDCAGRTQTGGETLKRLNRKKTTQDGTLTFTAERKLAGMDHAITVEYKLPIDGDKLKGKGAAEFGGEKREWDIEGKRLRNDK